MRRRAGFGRSSARLTAVNCHHNYVARERHYGAGRVRDAQGRGARAARATSASSRAAWARARTSCAGKGTRRASRAAATARAAPCRATRRSGRFTLGRPRGGDRGRRVPQGRGRHRRDARAPTSRSTRSWRRSATWSRSCTRCGRSCASKGDDVLTIDGSQGEGGGQILRTALALSLVTSTRSPSRRSAPGAGSPGLLRQHLTAVNAAVAIGGAGAWRRHCWVADARPASGRASVKHGEYRFAIGCRGEHGTWPISGRRVCRRSSPRPGHHAFRPTSSKAAIPQPRSAAVRFPGARVSTAARAHGTAYQARVPPGNVRALPGRRRRSIRRPRHILSFGCPRLGPTPSAARARSVSGSAARALVAHPRGRLPIRELAVVRSRLGWNEDELRLSSWAQRHAGLG
mgnify:CR=1 FL=1